MFRTFGDVMMGTTVVRAIKQKFPDSVIDFVTEPQNKHLLEGNPDINSILIANNYWDANVIGINGGYDKIYRLNMIHQFDSMWHHIPEHQNQHLVEWYAKRAEIDVLDDKNIYIYLNEEDKACVDDYFEDLPKDKKIVLINTSSGAHFGGQRVHSKDWPIEFFSTLTSYLVNLGYTVVQIGAFNDKKIVNKHVIDFTGKFTVKQNAELMKRCNFFIGIDSGLAYLAGWAGIPSIVIMGSTQNQSKEIKGPSVGPRNDNVTFINPVRPDHQACKPVPCYINCQMQNFYGCILTISPKDVIKNEKMKELMDGIFNDMAIDLNFTTDDIEGFFSDSEGFFLQRFVENCASIDGDVVEIGSYMGKSTPWLARGAKKVGKTVCAIDTFEGSEEHKKDLKERGISLLDKFRENMSKKGVSDFIKTVVGFSYNVHDKIEKISLLFIDGDHSYEGVKKDFDLYSGKVSVGGYIAFHDAHHTWPGVLQFVNELMKNPEYSFEGECFPSIKIFKKVK